MLCLGVDSRRRPQYLEGSRRTDPSAPRRSLVGHARRPWTTSRDSPTDRPARPSRSYPRGKRGRARYGGGTHAMARSSSDAAPVIDRDAEAKTKIAAATAARKLSGPYG